MGFGVGCIELVSRGLRMAENEIHTWFVLLPSLGCDALSFEFVLPHLLSFVLLACLCAVDSASNVIGHYSCNSVLLSDDTLNGPWGCDGSVSIYAVANKSTEDRLAKR